MKAWEYYLSQEDLESALADSNQEVGQSRQTTFETVGEVALRASASYSHLTTADDIQNAILWDVTKFLEYSSTGTTSELEDIHSRYSDLLPAGHPETPLPEVSEYAAWVSGAPELDNSSRSAVVASIVPSEDVVQLLHASSRLRALLASGKLSADTLKYIDDAQLLDIPEVDED